MVKCVVSGCPNRTANGGNRGGFSRNPKRFFNFPKDPARIKVWLAALRETDKQDWTDQHFICEDHFLPEDITGRGVAPDAIPIMPPCLDGPMGLINPWGADSSEEDEQYAKDGDDEGDDEAPPEPDRPQKDPGAGLANPPAAEKTSAPCSQKKPALQSKMAARMETSLTLLTQRFLQLLLEAPDGSVDLRQVTVSLQIPKQRVDDITYILDEINMVEKESANKIRWIGALPISSFLWRNKFDRELENLKLVEATLDGLIKSCAQQLFDMTDDVENASAAYVTHQDVRRLQAFREQTVIVIKAPEETKMEIPVPTEDSVQVHLKAGRAPIKVMTCDVESGDAVTSDPGDFLTLEKSRISTTPLHTGPPSAGQAE